MSNAEPTIRDIRRDIDALIQAMNNYFEVQQIMIHKIDLILEAVDRPQPEDNPLVDALDGMASALKDVADRQETMLGMQTEAMTRLPPRPTH